MSAPADTVPPRAAHGTASSHYPAGAGTLTGACAGLADLQRRLQRFVLRADESAPADLVAESEAVPREARLGIYAHAYRVRLVETASADYNRLHTYLGDDQFDALIRAYLDAYPSRHPSLRWFGQHLPRFLRETTAYSQHMDLVEMAEFEWALCHAFDAADAEPVATEELARVPPQAWAGLRLTFHPSLRRLDLRTNVPRIWEALSEGHKPPEITLREAPAPWLVWRQDLRLLFRAASVPEAVALERFESGAPFGEACEALCEWTSPQGVPLQAAGFLRRWLDDKLVVGLSL